jgi:beta-xylosidase/lysophospholipase L1-like esterase
MPTIQKRALTVFAGTALMLGAVQVRADAPALQPVRVILVGDSTMAPNGGYGDALCRRLPGVACINRGAAGRSSSSYRAEGKWDAVRKLLSDDRNYAATYVLVQFGHNDQPGKPGRSTDLATEFPANMQRYAAETQAAGAIPVLVTPLARRTFESGRLTDTLAPWAEATRRTAAATRSTLVDLHALSTSVFKEMGAVRAATLSPPPKLKNGVLEPDVTHLNPEGAEVISEIMVRELVHQIPVLAATPGPDAPWVADLGNGRYQNPVLHADYSDPDAIRVGDRFYMTASSFSNVPGLPLLESPDLVNWKLVGHALPKLVPQATFATTQYGNGVWAPCLRWHAGRFYIFYPDPDFGIYVTEAGHFAGPWTEPRLILPGRGLIDPTPLWDDTGEAYLIHAWARSRAGRNNVLTLRRMDADATRMLDDDGTDIIDGAALPGYRTLEGPKVYKANGYYYVFAPAGGVEQGWQAVFRSRAIAGPYEERRVMDQGDSPVNGPHQGAWINAPDGKDWFVHFQDKGAYGRVMHLQPMQWKDGWPLIGAAGPKPGTGQPVLTHAKPVQGYAPEAPATSDDFRGPQLSAQWQWGGNPQSGWYALGAKPGVLQLFTQALPGADGYVRASPAILTQKVPAPRFVATTHVGLRHGVEGDRAGLIVNGLQYAWLGLRRQGATNQLVWTTCAPAVQRCTERPTVVLENAPAELTLRVRMDAGASVAFSYSVDDKTFLAAGQPFTVSQGLWVGAQVGLFSVGNQAGSWLDVAGFWIAAPDGARTE